MKRRRTAESNADEPPLTKAELSKLRPVSQAKKLRLKLGLSQSEFAARFGIPIGTLRDWEQHVAKPDKAAALLLMVIATEPDVVARAAKKLAKAA